MSLYAVRTPEQGEDEEALLDRVFFALSDPVRRAIMTRLGEGELLVSELAAPFDISLPQISDQDTKKVPFHTGSSNKVEVVTDVGTANQRGKLVFNHQRGNTNDPLILSYREQV